MNTNGGEATKGVSEEELVAGRLWSGQRLTRLRDERLEATGQFLVSQWEELAPWLAEQRATRVFVVLDRQALPPDLPVEAIAGLMPGVALEVFDRIAPNPPLELAEEAAAAARRQGAELVLGFGGGSSLDLAKLVALGASEVGDADGASWSEVVRAGRSLEAFRPRPLAAIPTTAGSGSEATHFAVTYVGGAKRSVVHPGMRPAAVVLDERLVAGMPRPLAAASGLDALAQALESMWAVGANDASRCDSLLAASLMMPVLERSVLAPRGGARRFMQWGSHVAGQAINVSKTTAAHALSYALTKRYQIPHGLAVALTLGHVAAWNAGVTDDDCLDPAGPDAVRQRVAAACRWLGVEPAEMPGRMVALLRTLELPASLDEAAVPAADLPDLAAAVDPVRLDNNPRRFTADDLESLLRHA